jgi:hypothetical protein
MSQISATTPDALRVLPAENEPITRQHRLAVRCVNAVLRLHHLRHYADGDRHGRAALLELRDAVTEVASLCPAGDPFCRDEVIETAGETATSAHAAALALAQRTWDAVQLTFLQEQARTHHRDEQGTPYTRLTSQVVRRSPTEGSDSAAVWREVCAGLDRYPAPEAPWFQAALAVEWNQAARRQEDRRNIVGPMSRAQPLAVGAIVASGTAEPPVDPPPRLAGNLPGVPAALAHASGVADASGDGTAPRQGENEWRQEGEYWTLTFAQHTIRLRDTVGLQYLAYLLAKPGRDTPAAVLVAARSGKAKVKPLAGSAVLDEEAMANYRERYEDLCGQLAEAEEHDDPAKQEELQSEFAALAQQFFAATGLGGRRRKMSDQADRVRKAVSIAITRTIAAIENQQHPALAQHLTHFVRMGGSFCYAPDPTIDWLL